MSSPIHLEKEARTVCEANASRPYLHELAPDEGRRAVDKAQDKGAAKHGADITDHEMDLGGLGVINVRVVRPENEQGSLPVIVYLHGGGWVFGNAHTHDKLIRELAVRTGSVVVFPEYSLSPEARYPTALRQCFAVLEKAADQAGVSNWDPARLFVAGDSAGANMATALTMLAKEEDGPDILGQLLFYPVTDASCDTGSHRAFAQGYYLHSEGMRWFWDQYTESPDAREEKTASPLRAEKDDLADLPQALVITAEADVLRDEGEAYARKLCHAGVPVTALRCLSTIHDFCMLNALDRSKACRAAMDQAVAWIKGRSGSIIRTGGIM